MIIRPFDHALWLAVLAIFMFAMPAAANGRNYYVAPHGDSAGDGTRAHPFNVNDVFSGRRGVGPGDTVFLSSGTYKGRFDIKASGSAAAPVVVMSAPGAWAVFAGALELHDNTHYLWLMNFEITGNFDSSKLRVTTEKGSNIAGLNRKDGLIVGTGYNRGIKVINLLIHDVVGDGLSIWSKAINTEAYGNIIYNNGWDAPDRGHGHGIYTQNDTGTKVICDNICFWNLGSCGIQVYTERGTIRNYRLDGNIHLNNDDWFLVGGYRPLDHITVTNNYMGENSKMNLGYMSKQPNRNLYAAGNYIQNAIVAQWENMTFVHNTIFGELTYAPIDSTIDTGYHIDSNIYYRNGEKINYCKMRTSFAEMNGMGFERHGEVRREVVPNDNLIVVRPNKYEPGRANIVVYNWVRADKVAVNLAGVLEKGDRFEIRDVQHYLGEPVVTGTFTGATIDIPMKLTAVDTLMGDFTGLMHDRMTTRKHSTVVFGTYVVRKADAKK